MRIRHLALPTVALFVLVAVIATVDPAASRNGRAKSHTNKLERTAEKNALTLLQEGRRIFRHDTFGDEIFWGDALKLHQAIAGAANGGVGSGLSPTLALQLGLKVDVEALPGKVRSDLKRGKLDLEDPAVTLALLQLDAVVGVTGFFTPDDTLRAVGIQCALCHSTVDDSFAPSIGRRLDGWANRDLDVGRVIAFAPDLSVIAGLLEKTQDEVRTVLTGWGPGKFDAELLLDGKTEGPNGSAATLIPPAFGLAGVNQHTWTGAWGTVSYWNAFVANLEMRGQGVFFDPRLDDPAQFPVAAKHRELYGHKRDPVDLITSKLPALHFYQLALSAPSPPAGTFDAAAAVNGKKVFDDAECDRCHVPPLFTEPGWNLHPASDIGIDDFQARRSPDHVYRTAPLNGLWTHQKGGFYHDGRFATLLDVVEHYNQFFTLGLGDADKHDLVEYLKSLPAPAP